ncbi:MULTISPECIES: anti-sigma factor domain-containing protein [unclassified Clostridium]|uniref:anti-sigma factor domain-containing protein n=1 Tax=unclassified Clostridium TaxID=2614128 RepID=UPI0013F0738F|nr:MULTISPECIES: anti-sigma factor domain-containing protein [unclassified Clostridium]NFG62219.1 anti-sigma factor domain-containing protein [Clostridium botulinum]NFQ09539.1 anti-sigma factor domain-containing protein [Clostridium botulinum]
MSKGIIMEIKKEYAIVMNDTGSIESIKVKDGMKLGQKIFYFEEDLVNINQNRSVNKISLFKTFGTFAALFLLIFTFFQPLAFNKAYAVVSLDINPSIQIQVNNKKKIVAVEGVNEDGKNIDFSSINGLEIDKGIEGIKAILVEKEYLGETGEVLVAFALLDKHEDENYENQIQDAIKTTFKTENVTYVKGSKEAVEEAKTKGISLGRYEVSLSADETVKSKIENIPVKEITSLIKDKENCIYWKADNAQNSEKPEINNNLSDDKYSDKPENTLENNTIPKKDKIEETIKEITPEVQKPIEDNKESEIKKDPEEVPETKPEIVLPPIEEIKPGDNTTNNEETEDKNNETSKDKNNGSVSNITDTGKEEQNLKK